MEAAILKFDIFAAPRGMMMYCRAGNMDKVVYKIIFREGLDYANEIGGVSETCFEFETNG